VPINKIIMIGSAGTGKTSLLRRFSRDEFDPGELTSVGLDFKTFRTEIYDKYASF
jgi:GTPase SAR1 family protein